MKYSPILFHSPLYRSFIIVLGKLLYEYRPNSERVLLLFTVFSAERPHFGKGIQVFLIYSLIAVHISRLRNRKLADISGEPF